MSDKTDKNKKDPVTIKFKITKNGWCGKWHDEKNNIKNVRGHEIHPRTPKNINYKDDVFWRVKRHKNT